MLQAIHIRLTSPRAWTHNITDREKEKERGSLTSDYSVSTEHGTFQNNQLLVTLNIPGH